MHRVQPLYKIGGWPVWGKVCWDLFGVGVLAVGPLIRVPKIYQIW